MSVLHIDGGRAWGGGQNQVRLLMRELARRSIPQLCICPANSPLAQVLTHAGLPVQPVTWTSGSDPRAFMAIARSISSFDVVHAHDASAFQLAIIPARLRRVPLVASRRTRFTTSALKWNRAQCIIAIAQGVRDVLIAAGVQRDKIVVIHSGIDIEESRKVERAVPSLRSRTGIEPQAFVAGNAGHLFEVKAQRLIPAAAAFTPGVQWLIAGEGPERAALEAAITLHDVADRVRLLGWLDDGRTLLSEIDAYVSPATDEALGTMVLEAMARGVPVVAANAGGPAEILAPVHAQTGAVLVAPNSAAALAEGVQRIQNDAALRQLVTDWQTERLKDFDSTLTATATLSVYQRVVNG